jgi:hypothetical protein
VENSKRTHRSGSEKMIHFHFSCQFSNCPG